MKNLFIPFAFITFSTFSTIVLADYIAVIENNGHYSIQAQIEDGVGEIPVNSTITCGIGEGVTRI